MRRSRRRSRRVGVGGREEGRARNETETSNEQRETDSRSEFSVAADGHRKENEEQEEKQNMDNKNTRNHEEKDQKKKLKQKYTGIPFFNREHYAEIFTSHIRTNAIAKLSLHHSSNESRAPVHRPNDKSHLHTMPDLYARPSPTSSPFAAHDIISKF